MTKLLSVAPRDDLVIWNEIATASADTRSPTRYRTEALDDDEGANFEAADVGDLEVVPGNCVNFEDVDTEGLEVVTGNCVDVEAVDIEDREDGMDNCIDVGAVDGANTKAAGADDGDVEAFNAYEEGLEIGAVTGEETDNLEVSVVHTVKSGASSSFKNSEIMPVRKRSRRETGHLSMKRVTLRKASHERRNGNPEGCIQTALEEVATSDRIDVGNDQAEKCSSRAGQDYHSSFLGKRKYTPVKRVRREAVGPTQLVKARGLYWKKIRDEDVSKWNCCRKLQCFVNTEPLYFKTQSERLLLATQAERKQALWDMLSVSDGKFYFNHNRVCTFFLLKGFRFSKDLQLSVKHLAGNCIGVRAGNSPRYRTIAAQRDLILEFLTSLAQDTANIMPDSDEVHLPFHQKTQVYDVFRQRCKKDEEFGLSLSPPSYSYFTAVWKQTVGTIKTRKVQRFSKCYDCELARDKLSKFHFDKAVCKQVSAKHRQHLMFIRLERAGYASRVRLAITSPKRVCSIVVDGADQSEYGLPHFADKSKEARGESMKVKLVGLLDHGRNSLHLYTMTGEFETGANHVIEVIHRWINYKVEKDILPPVLYVQMDNCWRENKNRFMLGYLESLIAWGLFEEIHASFLPVGHTHCDIDQRFSCTSKRLRANSAITLSELHQQLRASMEQSPVVSSLNHVANISGLFSLVKCLRKTTAITPFRYFRFIRGIQLNGSTPGARFATRCMVKVNYDDIWKPLHEEDPCAGFLIKPPDLSRTPDTVLMAPPKVDEVDKRFVSEAARMDQKHVEQLEKLRDKVFKDRSDPFHWNLRSVIEMKSARGEHIIEQSLESEDIDFNTYVPVNNVSYTVNKFVIVRYKGATMECPFWVGQVEDITKNVFGDISGVVVRWYETLVHEDAFSGTYKPSVFKSANGQKRPWISTICTDSIMFEINGLTSKSKLGWPVVRKVSQSLQSHRNRR